MPVKIKSDLSKLVNQMDLSITHFARGTFPEADGSISTLPVNRILFVLANTDNAESFLDDDMQHISLKEGMAYFIPLYHPVRIKLSGGLTFLSIQFRLELHRTQDIFSGMKRLITLNDTQKWLPALNKAFDANDRFQGAILLRCVTDELIAHLFSLARQEELTVLHAHSHYDEVIRYAQENCNASLSVADLADFCGERRETFTRKFTAATGITPKNFLTHLLLTRAYDLLSRNELLIKEIALELGFSNEFYFSRFIRKHTGKSPLRFRAEHCSVI